MSINNFLIFLIIKSSIILTYRTCTIKDLNKSSETSTGWKFHKLQEKKVFIHNYLDNILDSDIEEYHEETEYLSYNEHTEDKNTKLIDIICIKTYVLKVKEILHGTKTEKEKSYLDICRNCKHLFNDENECLNMTITLVSNHIEIKVPQLGLMLDKRGLRQSIIINYPITYVLSKLMYSLINVNPYDEKQMNFACDSLLTKLSAEINKNIMDLIGDLHIFNKDVGKYITTIRSFFTKCYNENEKSLLNSCRVLRNALDKVKELNKELLNNSKEKFLEPHKYIKKIDENIIHLLPIKNESNLHYYIKQIYNFIYISSSIVDEMEKIYIREINDSILKKREFIDLFYLRDTNHIKNICSIRIMTTISWFFNQINLDMFNKNKKIKTLFNEKFSFQNLRNMVFSIFNSVSESKGDILDLCMDSMADVIYTVSSMLSNYYEKETFFSRDNLTFSKLIKFTEIYVLRYKLKDMEGENYSIESMGLRKMNPFNINKIENLVCMMKRLSNKMNFYISLLKKSYLQELMYENYDKYIVENIFIDDSELFFCTSSGEYLIHKEFFNNVFKIISV
ncbi:conserved Plasmodium protein, unknown function [Plasmodium gallinaceum]|uniref:Fam-f protein n=1 Tax=Plasmodium gallinaceum TaxID=5849 RepID=A0A1J1GRB5_PLAGA|nr:conserved Plasmodium protein, unknown function [Plasmodium gallinaceum]CRG93824.1 conserved Plasmodium protein, unknown function [Plasmodium gallinaceum]